jgi:hypothetical protein
MFRALIKLAVVVIVLNALYHAGDAYWRFYQLKDSSEQALIFGVDAKPERLKEQILKRAADLKVPVSPQSVMVMKEGGRSEATVTYLEAIEVFPGYRYSKVFTFTVNAVVVR